MAEQRIKLSKIEPERDLLRVINGMLNDANFCIEFKVVDINDTVKSILLVRK